MDTVIDLASASAEERDAFIAIYEEALPRSERKSRETILRQAAQADFRGLLWCRDGAVIGFAIVYLPEGEDFALLEYLGVQQRARGGGMGAKMLDAVLVATGDRPLVIEVDSDREDAPDRALRERRRGFYERAGARRIDGIDYRMPSVGEGVPPALDLMVHPRGRALTVTPALAAGWIRSIYRGVYDVGIGEAELQVMLRNMPAGPAA